MTTLVDLLAPRFSREQVEAAILAIPLQRFTAALHFGLSDEDGCRLARAQMADDVRVELMKAAAPQFLLITDPQAIRIPIR